MDCVSFENDFLLFLHCAWGLWFWVLSIWRQISECFYIVVNLLLFFTWFSMKMCFFVRCLYSFKTKRLFIRVYVFVSKRWIIFKCDCVVNVFFSHKVRFNDVNEYVIRFWFHYHKQIWKIIMYITFAISRWSMILSNDFESNHSHVLSLWWKK